MGAPKRLAKIVDELKRDPVAHIERAQGVGTLEDYQAEICRAIAEYPRVSIAACHDVGKTWTMAKIVLWFGSMYEGSKIITTAPTHNQVKRLLWSEIRSGYEKSKIPLGGVMLTTEWKISSDWFALGFTSKPEASGGEGQGTASGFQGFHAPYVLIIFDEATGISASIWKQVEGMLTSGFVRFVAIGNPTSKGTPFFRTFSQPGVKKIYLSCFNSPNLIANGITCLKDIIDEVNYIRELKEVDAQARLASYVVTNGNLLTTRWVIEKAIEWDVDHPLFQSKVLGIFPEEDEHALFSLGKVEACIYRGENRMDEVAPKGLPIIFGVDVARFGSDKSVITKMEGAEVTELKKLIKSDTAATAGEIINLVNACPRARRIGCAIVVDGTGVGGGVIDILRQYKRENIDWRKVEIMEVNFGDGFNEDEFTMDYEADEKKKKYANRKAEIFVLLAADIKTDIALPNDSAYLEELPTIIYRFDSKGRYVMESKDEYKKRTGRSSPDTTDSLALANWGRRQHNLTQAPEDSNDTTVDETYDNDSAMAPGLDSGDKW